MRRITFDIPRASTFFLAMLLNGVLLSGCIINVDPNHTDRIRGSGLLETQTVDVSDFSRVSMAIPAELTIRQGSEEALEISAQANLLPYIDIYVDEDKLYIETDDDIQLQPTRTITIQLTVKSLREMTFAGTGRVKIDTLATPTMAVTLAGDGDVEVNQLTTVLLETILAGSGDMYFSGVVDEHAIFLEGSGDIEARELESHKANVEISGSGSMVINVEEELKVSIIGSGSVRYLGNPTVETTIVGSGTVSPLGG